MVFSFSASSSKVIEVVHCQSPSGGSHDPQQRLVSEFASLSTMLSAGYTAPFGRNGVIQTILSSLKYERRAFPAEPAKTFYLEFADGGNTQVQVSLGDDAPEDTPTFIGVHGMAGDLEAPYLHEVLSSLVKENRGRGVVFNLRGCGESTATSPTFHHGASTSDLGAVISWVTMKWPKGKVYVIGTSLGAVITAKTLGQWGEACPVSAAALISPVYDFKASCKAMETNFVSRAVFNPTVGAFYSKLDAFDIEHWTHTRPNPFPATTTSISNSPPFLESISSEFARELWPFTKASRNNSSFSSFLSTPATSVSSSLPSPTTPGSSWPPTPLIESNTPCLTPPQGTSSASIVPDYTPEISDALTSSLRKITSRILPQSLTGLCKTFVAATAHFLSGEEFMASTSAVDDLPNIRVPCLAVNCADDPLMPGKDLPRSQARKSPFFLMAVLKKGGHLGTFTTKKWKKRNGDKRYHTALVEEWFKANEALPQLRPRPQIVNARQGFVYPRGHPEMAFRETTSMYLKLKFTRPTYPKSK
ncbi:hypothetical protein FS837_009655 [Tulasnella sp. UAMH 9824]|nr:hypothetical protein FS837_009655 [Tulasnella sp. UAMH 9824]